MTVISCLCVIICTIDFCERSIIHYIDTMIAVIMCTLIGLILIGVIVIIIILLKCKLTILYYNCAWLLINV